MLGAHPLRDVVGHVFSEVAPIAVLHNNGEIFWQQEHVLRAGADGAVAFPGQHDATAGPLFLHSLMCCAAPQLLPCGGRAWHKSQDKTGETGRMTGHGDG